MFKQPLSAACTNELEMRLSMCERDSETIASNIVGYPNDERVHKQRATHPDDMDVWFLRAAKLSTSMSSI